MINNYCDCDIDKKISYISRKEYKYFLNKCNVIGVGIGYKIKNGFNTSIKCIKVFVVTKVSLNNLSREDIIPSMYKDIPTDVVESGYIYGCSLSKRVRPTICGYSIGPVGFKHASTLGCIVTAKGQKFILGSTHGIVHEPFPIGGNILQPASGDGGIYPKDQIGSLEKYIPLKPSTTYDEPDNIIDGCIIRVPNETTISNEIYGVGKLKGIQSPRLNQQVVKVGRSTELTTGKIISLDTTIEAEINDKEYLFINQIMTTNMSSSGDSGAVLVGNGNFAIGLLCAGGKSNTVYNKIDAVLKTLDVKVDTD